MNKQSIIVHKSALLAAAQKRGLSPPEAEKLWLDLSPAPSTEPDSPKSKIPRVLYFLGAWVICLALAWFMGNQYSLYGVPALLSISIVYAVGFMGVGLYLWRVKQKKTLGGLGIFLSVSLVPLITYALQDLMGWWPGKFPGEYPGFFSWVSGGWAIMELATIGACLTALHFIRFPLLTVPLYVALWFMAMDIAPVFSPVSDSDGGFLPVRIALCLLLGLVLVIKAISLDRSQKTDFAFWGHLFGVAIFWSGMTLIDDTGWLENTLYLLVNLAMIILSPILQRKVFLVFGTIGLLTRLFWLANQYFADSAYFPFILSGMGLLVIIAGWILQRNWPRNLSQ